MTQEAESVEIMGSIVMVVGGAAGATVIVVARAQVPARLMIRMVDMVIRR
jgi:hypothetical protein